MKFDGTMADGKNWGGLEETPATQQTHRSAFLPPLDLAKILKLTLGLLKMLLTKLLKLAPNEYRQRPWNNFRANFVYVVWCGRCELKDELMRVRK